MCKKYDVGTARTAPGHVPYIQPVEVCDQLNVQGSPDVQAASSVAGQQTTVRNATILTTGTFRRPAGNRCCVTA